MSNSLAELSAIASGKSTWEPYWDENYQRYYWSDGKESVRLLRK